MNNFRQVKHLRITDSKNIMDEWIKQTGIDPMTIVDESDLVIFRLLGVSYCDLEFEPSPIS